MKGFIVFGLICLFPVNFFCQENVTIRSKDILIGRNFRSNADINAKIIDFPEKIYRWNVNDSTNTLTLQLRGIKNDGLDMDTIGYILFVDLPKVQVRWNQMVNFNNSTIDQYDHILIKSTNNQSTCLNNDNGENLWSANNAICYVNPTKQIGVGYRISDSGDFTNTLEGINLKTGHSVWKRKINREYNLNDIFLLNDSVILVSANGLHTIDLKTGLGWDYDAGTGKKDYSNTVASNLFNFAFSVISGNDFEITTGHDMISGVVSNTLVDSTGIYMADKESIVRLDYHGNIVWKNYLPKNMVSRSSIFFKDSLIFMVNDGFASFNSESINYGKPFIAGYFKNTGKKAFLSKVGYKKEQILSYEILHDTLLLLSKNRVFKYSLTNGAELWEQNFKTDSLGELTQFAENELFVRSDSVFMNPLLSGSNNVTVSTNQNQLLVLNNDLKVTNIIHNDKIYTCYLETNGYKFVEVGNGTLVIDKNNKPVATLDVSANAILIGTKLYEAQGNSFTVIDLNEILMN